MISVVNFFVFFFALLVVYTDDWDGPIRLKVNGYASESVQSDIKLSFTSIFIFLIFVL